MEEEEVDEAEKSRLELIKADELLAWRLARENPHSRAYTRQSRRRSNPNGNPGGSSGSSAEARDGKPKPKPKPKAKKKAPAKGAKPKANPSTKRKSLQSVGCSSSKKQRTGSRPPTGSRKKAPKGPPKRSRKVTCAAASASGTSFASGSASSSVPSTRRSEIETNNNNNMNISINISIDMNINSVTPDANSANAGGAVMEESEADDGHCARSRGWNRPRKDKRYVFEAGEESPYPAIVKKVHDDCDADIMNARSALTDRERRQISRHYTRGLERSGITSECVRLNPLGNRAKKVGVRVSRIHGMGLFAAEDIEEGEFVLEFLGEHIRQAVANVREKVYERSGMGYSYFFQLNTNTVIDATRKGSAAKFINHHCTPNVLARFTRVKAETRICFYALKKIKRGNEITYDYRYAKEPDTEKIKCLCDSKDCLGTLN